MKLNIILFILIVSLSVFSQTKENKLKADGQVKYRFPTVYIEYVCQDEKNIQLRLTNNTIWAITIGTDRFYPNKNKTVNFANGNKYQALPNKQEITIQYYIEKFAMSQEKVEVPEIKSLHTSYSGWIPSNDSILFSVPKEYLNDKLQVFLKFNYEWEQTKSGAIASGPEHRARFRGIDIPENKILCRKIRENCDTKQ